MVITWHGEGAVKIVDKEVTVAINPHDGKSSKLGKFNADLLLAGGSYVAPETVKDSPFTISNPGEYEVKGVFVYGIAAQGEKDEKINIFLVDVDGVTIGYLGGLAQKELTGDQLEQLEGVDVLIVPVGEKGTLDPKQAIKCINQVEPRLVIPIDYKTQGSTVSREGVENFLREYGVEKKHDVIDKLKLTKKDLPQDDTRVVVLQLS
jgi:L-ascorbate metabolism protein UlaG (beta-lactamase superfamily)